MYSSTSSKYSNVGTPTSNISNKISFMIDFKLHSERCGKLKSGVGIVVHFINMVSYTNYITVYNNVTHYVMLLLMI